MEVAGLDDTWLKWPLNGEWTPVDLQRILPAIT